MQQQEKARYWTAVCYPENMIDGWQTEIGDILQLPGSYCEHNKDTLAKYQPKRKDDIERMRKDHVHIIIVYNNTTTYNSVLQTINKLSAPGKQCCNKVESISDIRHMYEYLIHNTKTAKNQGKYQYDPSERIEFNNFDIGAYEQLSTADKNLMAQELCDLIMDKNITNFGNFYLTVKSNYGIEYFEIIKTYSGLFERLTKSNYQTSQGYHVNNNPPKINT